MPPRLGLLQVIIQDVVLKWRRKGGGQPGGSGSGGETGMAKLGGGERHTTLLSPGMQRSDGLG